MWPKNRTTVNLLWWRTPEGGVEKGEQANDSPFCLAEQWCLWKARPLVRRCQHQDPVLRPDERPPAATEASDHQGAHLWCTLHFCTSAVSNFFRSFEVSKVLIFFMRTLKLQLFLPFVTTRTDFSVTFAFETSFYVLYQQLCAVMCAVCTCAFVSHMCKAQHMRRSFKPIQRDTCLRLKDCCQSWNFFFDNEETHIGIRVKCANMHPPDNPATRAALGRACWRSFVQGKGETLTAAAARAALVSVGWVALRVRATLCTAHVARTEALS